MSTKTMLTKMETCEWLEEQKVQTWIEKNIVPNKPTNGETHGDHEVTQVAAVPQLLLLGGQGVLLIQGIPVTAGGRLWGREGAARVWRRG